VRPRLRATVRLSWALVRRSEARSALIALLVAVPVCAGVFVATMTRTAQLSPAQAAPRYLGQADAIAQVSEYLHLDPRTSAVGMGPSPSGDQKQTLEVTSSRPQRNSTSVDLPSLLPAGARAIPFGWQRNSSVSTGSRTTEAAIILADLGDPMARGIYDIEAGTAPRARTDVAVTTALAHQLRLHPGSTITIDGGAFHVTAVVRKPSGLKSHAVVGPEGSVGRLGEFHAPYGVPNPSWLITFPRHAAPDLHDQLAADGVIYETRTQWEHPTGEAGARLDDFGGRADRQDLLIRITIAVFGALEVLLLAGTAFAVGARREIEQLGVLRAVGGDQGDVRRAVLGQGIVLGFIGSVVGAAAGIAAVPLAQSTIESVTARALGPLDVPVRTLLLGILAGSVAAVVAAALPARYAGRLPVLTMLRHEFPTTPRAVRMPRWAIAACVLGVSLVAFAAVKFHNSSRHLVSQQGSPDGTIRNFYGPQNHQTLWTVLISVGAALLVAGLARICPTLLAQVGRLAPRLPFILRLPVRDVGRQRHRTAPATAAIATVIGGAVLVLFVASSSDLRDQRSYVPNFPTGTVSVESRGHPELLNSFTRTVADALHAPAAGTAAYVTGKSPAVYVGAQPPACPAGPEDLMDRCDSGVPIVTADASWVDAVVGHHVSKAADMLAHGGVVAFSSNIADHGHVTIAAYSLSEGDSGTPVTTPIAQLPALVLPAVPATQRVPSVVMTPATATAHHWGAQPAWGIVRPAKPPSSGELAKIRHSLGDRATLRAEHGYQTNYGTLVLALIAAAALVLFAGTGITVALTMAESRNDMSILRAVGASHGRRRLYAMGQAGVVGTVGAILGLALGTAVGLALQFGSADYPVSFPARWLALTVAVGVVVAVAFAGVLTRSKTPLPRRAI
jgi:putative ABC transport system permease protein